MRLVFLSLVGILSIFGVASGLKSPRKQAPFSEILTSTSSSTLNIRGGAGALDQSALNAAGYLQDSKSKVAMAGAVLVGAGGLLNILCSETIMNAHGATNAMDDDLMINEFIGFTQLTDAVMTLLIVAYGVDVNTALAYGLVPQMIFFTLGLINEVPKKFGTSSSKFKFWMATDVVLHLGLLKGTSWANDAYKSVISVTFFSHAITRLDPAKTMEFCGRTKALAPLTVSLLKISSEVGMSMCVLAFALASGVDPYESLGLGWATIVVTLFISTLITKELDENINRNIFMAWVAVSATIAGTLLF